MKYKAFISYSHKDEKFAKWLHKKLESYKIPKELHTLHPSLPKNISPIFRDIEELSASSDLPKEILEALGDSEYLIVICSPHSAQSQWVNQEIVDFKSMYGEERVLSIILDGEPYDKEKECFPEALKYRVKNAKVSKEKAEPIAADVRGKWRSEWEFGKLKLISGLLELDFEELNKREEKRRRKNRFIWGVISLIIIVSLSSLAWYSFVQKGKAEVALYNILIQRGIAKKSNNKKMEAKLFFADAIAKSINQEDEENAKILYNSIKLNLKLEKILEFEKVINSTQISKDGTKTLELIDNNTGVIKDKKSRKVLYLLNSNGFGTSSKPIPIPLEWKIDTAGNIKIFSWKNIIEYESDSSQKVPNFKKYKVNILKANNGVMFYDKKEDKKIFLENVYIDAGIYNKSRTRILTWSSNFISLWSKKGGKELVQIIYMGNDKDEDKVCLGATFSENEKKIIIWDRDGVSEIYNLYEEITLDKKYYPLKTEVETGKYLTIYGEISFLSVEEWREKKAEYEKVAR